MDNDSMAMISNELNQMKSNSIYEKLHHLRRVCRLLSSASHNINEAYKYSIPLIIVNDFLQILINWYWILRILLEPKIRFFHLIPPLCWSLLNFHHVVTLSATCHYATDEVRWRLFCTEKCIHFSAFYDKISGKKFSWSFAMHGFS